MLASEQVEQLITLVCNLDRQALIQQFNDYPTSFPLDFTPEFLDRIPLERLRHIFVALCLQNKRLPDPICQAA